MTLLRSIENILFASENPCTIQKLSKLTGASVEDVTTALGELKKEFTLERGGLVLMSHDGAYTLATHPDAATIIQQLRKEEIIGELSRPALETLSVIAYRGPVTKPEIEQIRGVNCSISLRNLLMAGLIEDQDTTGERKYSVSMEFLRHLGVANLTDLPDYQRLNTFLVSGAPTPAEENSSLDL